MDAALKGPARGQQAVPCGGASLKRFGVVESLALQRLPQHADRVERLVVMVVHGQQVILLGNEQEHGAHHDGHSRLVDCVRCDAGQQRTVPVAVGSRDGVNK